VRRLLLFVLAALALVPASARAADLAVDLELVLAIDASSSVDDSEWALQAEGYATAFRDARVQAAVLSGPNRRVAVALLVWADATVPRWESDWFVLAGPSDAERLAAYMSSLPRQAVGGTGIGAASPRQSACSTATASPRRARWWMSPATAARRRRARWSS
jgi:hypothetical protein